MIKNCIRVYENDRDVNRHIAELEACGRIVVKDVRVISYDTNAVIRVQIIYDESESNISKPRQKSIQICIKSFTDDYKINDFVEMLEQCEYISVKDIRIINSDTIAQIKTQILYEYDVQGYINGSPSVEEEQDASQIDIQQAIHDYFEANPVVISKEYIESLGFSESVSCTQEEYDNMSEHDSAIYFINN